MADDLEETSDRCYGGKFRTVRFKKGNQSQEEISSKVEKILESDKNYRKPRTRKRAQNKVGFLDNSGRPIPVRSKRPRPRAQTIRSKNSPRCDGSNADDEILMTGEFDGSDNDERIQNPDDSLNLLIEECEKLLNGDEQQSRHEWKKRMTNLAANWESSRQKIFDTVLTCAAVLPNLCSKCSTAECTIRCRDCGCSTHLCSSCDELVHQKFPLHDREGVYHGYYRPLSPKQSLSSDGKLKTINRVFPPHVDCCPSCMSTGTMVPNSTESQCIVITIKGRFDLDKAEFHCFACQHVYSPWSLESVLQLGFWPGTPSNIINLYDTNLLLQWNLMQKRVPGVSEGAFLKSIQDYSCEKGRDGAIHSSIFGSSFREWKYCKYELDQLMGKDFMECPSCSASQHSAHVDGNMKLYRFKSAGKRRSETYYKEIFIASNLKVDQHVQEIYKKAKDECVRDDNVCGASTWRAAANSLKRKKGLDETGLEIVACRHAIAQHAVNMYSGEWYGYAHYLQTVSLLPRRVQFLWYDVICKYWPWLVNHDPSTSRAMKPALSVMHAKAHSWSCQVLWGGRMQEGACGTTGEEVELVNSHFSRLGTTTKHMLPERRDELLTEHALSWNKRKITDLPNSLQKRYAKAKIQLNIAVQEMVHLSGDLLMNDIVENIFDWTREVKEIAREQELCNKTMPLSSHEKFFLGASLEITNLSFEAKSICDAAGLLYSRTVKSVAKKVSNDGLNQLLLSCSPDDYMTANIAGKESLKSRCLNDLQRRLMFKHLAIAQLSHNMGKCADSSKQRMRMRGKISSEKGELAKLVSTYNQISNEDVEVEDVANGIFKWIDAENYSYSDDLPIRTKRLVVEKWMETKRFKEEQGLLKIEMSNFLNYYKSLIFQLRQRQKELETLNMEDEVTDETTSLKTYVSSSTATSVAQGKLALVRRGEDFALGQLARGISSFSVVLKSTMDEFEQLFDNTSDSESESDGDVRNDDSDSDDDDSFSGLSMNIFPENDDGLEKIIGVLVSDDVICWKFPPSVSQSTLFGNDGSNACSIIATLLGYKFLTNELQIPCDTATPLCLSWINAVCECISVGNTVYNTFRDNLPNRYLSIEEAAYLLSGLINADVTEILPVRLIDPFQPSTIVEQLSRMMNAEKSAAQFIIHERTSAFLCGDGKIVYFDSHLHPPHGSVLVSGSKLNLQSFCNYIWTLESQDVHEFGNLVHTSYPDA